MSSIDAANATTDDCASTESPVLENPARRSPEVGPGQWTSQPVDASPDSWMDKTKSDDGGVNSSSDKAAVVAAAAVSAQMD